MDPKRQRIGEVVTHNGCCSWTTYDGKLHAGDDNVAYTSGITCGHEPYLYYTQDKRPVFVGLNTELRIVIYSGLIGTITGGNVQLRREIGLDANNLQIWYNHGIVHRDGNQPAIISTEVFIWCVQGVITRIEWLPRNECLYLI